MYMATNGKTSVTPPNSASADTHALFTHTLKPNDPGLNSV